MSSLANRLSPCDRLPGQHARLQSCASPAKQLRLIIMHAQPSRKSKSAPLYDVILTGQIAPGHERKAVLTSLARLLQQDLRQITELMDTDDAVIKREVDAHTGHQYLQALAKTGAIGRLKPLSQTGAPTVSTGGPAPAGDSAHPNIRVISPRPQPADIAFAPIQANRITHVPGGIDINRIDTAPIEYDAIALSAVYENQEKDQIHVLIFRQDLHRPYQCDANRIAYNEFPGIQATSVIASLRLFLQLVAREHPSLRVDPPTAGFLVGRPPAILEIDPVKYTTMLGKTLLAMAAKPAN